MTAVSRDVLAPDVEHHSPERLMAQAVDFGCRDFLPAIAEDRIDPLARLMDPGFTETTWQYEHSRVGDLPGALHAKQVEALGNPARHRWLFWGNQVGKTTIGAVDIALKALGRHPLQLAGLAHMPPRTAWASALTWELWEKILLPELLSWLPPWRVLDAPPPFRMSQKRDIIVLADNGKESRITGKAAQQGAGAYQSARVDDIWLDEEHPESVWDEMQPRLLRFGGSTLATMTPILGMTYVHGRVYEPVQTGRTATTRHWYSHAGIRDNPAITEDARREMLEELRHNPSQLAARDQGMFTRPMGAVLPWEPKEHLVDLEEARLEWLRARGSWFGALDLGKWRFAFAFGASDTEGSFTFIDEYFSQNEDAATRARGITELLKVKWKVPDSIMIPADCADPRGIAELNEEFDRILSPYRVYAIDGSLKKKTTGIIRVENMLNRGALKVRRGMGADMVWRLGADASKPGKPVMGSRWMWEAANWQYPKTAEGKVVKDEPDDASADGADMMDLTRYLVVSFFPADVPKAPKKNPTMLERLQKEMEQLDKREERSRDRWQGKQKYGKPLRQG